MRISRLLILLIWMLFSQKMEAQDCGCSSEKGKCLQGNCRNGFGAMQFENGDCYEGNWKECQFDGQGAYYHANGATYVGEYKKSKRHGYGTYKWPEGDMYIGEYVNNKKEGCGQYIFASRVGESRVQKGYYKDNKFVGKDSVECPVVGENDNVLKPKLKGLTDNTHEAGDCVTGDCKNGNGIYVFKNGDRYEGDFKNGLKHGQGNYTAHNGDSYQGTYKDGLRHGCGNYQWANGAFYIGEFKFGKRNGHGQYTDEFGTIQEGNYSDNKYVGPSNSGMDCRDIQSDVPKPKKKLPLAFGWLNSAQNGQSVNGCYFIVEACVTTHVKPINVKIFNNNRVVAVLTAKDFREDLSNFQFAISHPILLNSGENNLYFTVEDKKKAVFFSQPIVIHKGSE